MTNQPKWLISAYAAFLRERGVPLDYKLSAEEHLQLQRTRKRGFCSWNIRTGRPFTRSESFASISCTRSWLPKRRRNADLAGRRCRGKSVAPPMHRNFRSRSRKDTACIVYSLVRRPPEGLRVDP